MDPKRVDQIFINQVNYSYNCATIKDHVHDRTGIESELILVDFLFIKNNNKAFKIVVPHGKMQQVIASMGNEIKAEPFRERGHTNNRRNNNTNNRGSNSNSTFRGPPPSSRRPPPQRQPHQRPYQRPDNFRRDSRFLRPEWQYYGAPNGGFY